MPAWGTVVIMNIEQWYIVNQDNYIFINDGITNLHN